MTKICLKVRGWWQWLLEGESFRVEHRTIVSTVRQYSSCCRLYSIDENEYL